MARKINLHSTREVLALRELGAITSENRWVVGSKLDTYIRSQTLVPSGGRLIDVLSHAPQDGFLTLTRSEFSNPRSYELGQFMARRIEGMWGSEFTYYHMARSGVIAEVLKLLMKEGSSERYQDLCSARDVVVNAIDAKIRSEVRAMEDAIVLEYLGIDADSLLNFPYCVPFDGDEGRSWVAILAGNTLGQLIREAYMGEREQWVDHPGFGAVLEWAEEIRKRENKNPPTFLTFLMPETVPGHVPSEPAGIFGRCRNPSMRDRSRRLAG